MKRDVDLVNYLPPYLKEFKEPIEALKAENSEFILIWDSVNQLLYNQFIFTADEEGISYFENLLGITPDDDIDLEARRNRVAVRWINTLPYTMKALLQKLNSLCEGASYVISNNFENGYTLKLVTNLEHYGQTEELYKLLQEMLPCNINIDSTNQIMCVVKSGAKFGCRIATKANITITHDFNETFPVQSNVSAVGAISETNRIQITHDFNETYKINGNAKVASGAASCDFVEIK